MAPVSFSPRGVLTILSELYPQSAYWGDVNGTNIKYGTKAIVMRHTKHKVQRLEKDLGNRRSSAIHSGTHGIR